MALLAKPRDRQSRGGDRGRPGVWAETVWPDIVVVVVMSGHFVPAARSIIKDARPDKHDAAIVP